MEERYALCRDNEVGPHALLWGCFVHTHTPDGCPPDGFHGPGSRRRINRRTQCSRLLPRRIVTDVTDVTDDGTQCSRLLPRRIVSLLR